MVLQLIKSMKFSLIFAAALALAFSASAQFSSSFTLTAQYDLQTNAPAVAIQRTNGSVVYLGSGWTNAQPVTNGDVWTLAYPVSDCQSNADWGSESPVVLVGLYKTITNSTTNSYEFWLRMPVHHSGISYAFAFDPTTLGSLAWQPIAATVCQPVTPSLPPSQITIWADLSGVGVTNDTYAGYTTLAANVADLAVGADFGLFVDQSNTVTAFAITTNANAFGQLNVPGSLSNNVLQVACGYRHALALKNDGTVAAWGDNTYGQCNVPSNLTGVAAVAGGTFHSVSISTNGTLTAWGSNLYGESAIPSGLSNVVQVAAGSFFTAVLQTNGRVTCWGTAQAGVTNVPSNATNIVRISAGNHHVAALTGKGTVVAWGQYGNNTVSSPSTTNVVYMASSDTGDWLITADGATHAVGYDNVVSMPPGISNVVMIAAKQTSHVIVSGAPILTARSGSLGSATVYWPSAVGGVLVTEPVLSNAWILVSNQVNYVREQKHVTAVNWTNGFFRLAPNGAVSGSVALNFGVGNGDIPAPVAYSGGGGGGGGGSGPPSPMSSMMTTEGSLSAQDLINAAIDADLGIPPGMSFTNWVLIQLGIEPPP